jgi:hypothetical protein
MFWAARALHWCMHRAEFIPRLTGHGNLFNVHRAGDRWLKLFIFNEEFLVNASHQLALITSLPFVHTARRYYRLNGLVSCRDWHHVGQPMWWRKLHQTCSFRGSKSRNKVENTSSNWVENWQIIDPSSNCYRLQVWFTISTFNPWLLLWRP